MGDAAHGLAPAGARRSTSKPQRRHSGTKWTPKEDDTLRRLVAQFGLRNWTPIASYFHPPRTGKQVRVEEGEGGLDVW